MMSSSTSAHVQTIVMYHSFQLSRQPRGIFPSTTIPLSSTDSPQDQKDCIQCSHLVADSRCCTGSSSLMTRVSVTSSSCECLTYSRSLTVVALTDSIVNAAIWILAVRGRTKLAWFVVLDGSALTKGSNRCLPEWRRDCSDW